jgi:hypothetical protein
LTEKTQNQTQAHERDVSKDHPPKANQREAFRQQQQWRPTSPQDYAFQALSSRQQQGR